jgi:hypothetical protein
LVAPDLAMRTVNGAEILEAVKDSDAVIATTTLFRGMYAVALPGQRFSFRDAMVREHPEAFVSVRRPGVDPSAAMRCIRAIDQQNTEPGAPSWATRRIAWPGQLFNRDDELVSAHPDYFAEESW